MRELGRNVALELAAAPLEPRSAGCVLLRRATTDEDCRLASRFRFLAFCVERPVLPATAYPDGEVLLRLALTLAHFAEDEGVEHWGARMLVGGLRILRRLGLPVRRTPGGAEPLQDGTQLVPILGRVSDTREVLKALESRPGVRAALGERA